MKNAPFCWLSIWYSYGKLHGGCVSVNFGPRDSKFSKFSYYRLAHTLRKLYFQFLSYLMGYDRGDRFHSILNQMELHLVQNQMKNCHEDLIPFNLKGIRNRVLSVYELICNSWKWLIKLFFSTVFSTETGPMKYSRGGEGGGAASHFSVKKSIILFHGYKTSLHWLKCPSKQLRFL